MFLCFFHLIFLFHVLIVIHMLALANDWPLSHVADVWRAIGVNHRCFRLVLTQRSSCHLDWTGELWEEALFGLIHKIHLSRSRTLLNIRLSPKVYVLLLELYYRLLHLLLHVLLHYTYIG